MTKKPMTKLQKVLNKVSSKYGATSKELLTIVANPTAAIHNLRSKGHNIKLIVKNKKGDTAYKLFTDED